MRERSGRLRAAVAIGVSLVGLQACQPSAPRSADRELVPVVKVTDGDTIRVLYRGQEERVRLIGIDTPEVAWYGGAGECFGVEAARYVKRRLHRQSVALVFDADRRDRYGRLLAYVYVRRELLNLTLVRLGYATADAVRPNTMFARLFTRAETDARRLGRGMWSACDR